MKKSSFLVPKDSDPKLKDFDSKWCDDLDEEAASEKLAKLGERIETLQKLMYGSAQHSVLIILQGMDASGKDGTIRNAFNFLNPLGCHVFPFKSPTEEELGHDFLWRIHKHTPQKGQISIFNRSHYEDILFPSIHKSLPKDEIEKRLKHINDFEKLLVDSNTIVIKFFLNIGKDEQKERLLRREHDISAAWKINPDDWDDRKRWSEFEKTYEKIFRETSTKHAPWYIIPSDHKWFRNVAVAEIFVKRLEQFSDGWQDVLQAQSRQKKAALARAKKTK